MSRYAVVILPCVAGKLCIGERLCDRLLKALRVGSIVVVLVIHHVLVAQVLVVRVKQVVVPLLDLALQ